MKHITSGKKCWCNPKVIEEKVGRLRLWQLEQLIREEKFKGSSAEAIARKILKEYTLTRKRK